MKIIVSDFDNTFFDTAFKKNIDRINKFVKDGNMFIIATGRNMQQLQHEIYDKNISCEYYICNDGAAIYDHDLNIIYRKDIKPEVVKPIFQILNSEPDILEVYIDTTNGYVTDYYRACNKLVAKPFDKINAQKLLSSILKKYPDVNGYLSENWININDKSVSKGNAIEYLKKYFNLNSNDIYTIGDNINDLSMMKKYNSFAIKNNPNIQYNSKYTVNSFAQFLDKVKSDL